MLYEVKLKHTFKAGSRTLTYTSYVGQEESDLLDDPEFGYSSESLAVELAIHKFFKDYIMNQGTTIEVLSIEVVE